MKHARGNNINVSMGEVMQKAATGRSAKCHDELDEKRPALGLRGAKNCYVWSQPGRDVCTSSRKHLSLLVLL